MIAKNIEVDALHGDLLQKERDKVMRAFKNHNYVFSCYRCCCRDDVKGTFVVHYQLPESDEYYTHRSGRTARAGNHGTSLCLVDASQVKTLRKYERVLGIY